MVSVRRGTRREPIESIIGCIVCDREDERRAAKSAPGEKAPRRLVTEADRDEALSRLFSGEAYREHESLKSQLVEAHASGIPLSEIAPSSSHGGSRSGFRFDDEPDGFEDFAW